MLHSLTVSGFGKNTTVAEKQQELISRERLRLTECFILTDILSSNENMKSFYGSTLVAHLKTTTMYTFIWSQYSSLKADIRWLDAIAISYQNPINRWY